MLAFLGEILADALAFSLGQELGDAMRRRRPLLTQRAIERRRTIYGVIFALGCAAILASLWASRWSGALYLFLGGLVVSVFSVNALLELRRMKSRHP
jgi:hypothetical protein